MIELHFLSTHTQRKVDGVEERARAPLSDAHRPRVTVSLRVLARRRTLMISIFPPTSASDTIPHREQVGGGRRRAAESEQGSSRQDAAHGPRDQSGNQEQLTSG